MAYFTPYPVREYPISDNDIAYVKDIVRNTKIRDYRIDDVLAYDYYVIQDGERPDQVSQKLYGTPAYWWTFFYANEVLRNGLYAWPKSSEEIERHIYDKYVGFALTGYRTSASATKDETNMVANLFEVGENIVGQTSGAAAIVLERNAQMNQLIIDVQSGSFTGTEDIVGQTSGDTLYYNADYRYSTVAYKDAIKYYSDGSRFDFVLNDDSALSAITYADAEYLNKNELENIRYVRPEHVVQFTEDFGRLIRQ